MSRQLRSELLKLRTTRTLALLLLAAGGLDAARRRRRGLSRDRRPSSRRRRRSATMFSAGVTRRHSSPRSRASSPSRASSATARSARRCSSSRAGGSSSRRSSPRPRSPGCCSPPPASPSPSAPVSHPGGAGHRRRVTRRPHAARGRSAPVVAAPLGAIMGVAIGTLIRNQAGAIVALAGYALVVDAGALRRGPVGRPLPARQGRRRARRPAGRRPPRPGHGRRGACRMGGRVRRRGDAAQRPQRRLSYRAPAAATASTARTFAWTRLGGSGPAASSTTNAEALGSAWFSQRATPPGTCG